MGKFHFPILIVIITSSGWQQKNLIAWSGKLSYYIQELVPRWNAYDQGFSSCSRTLNRAMFISLTSSSSSKDPRRHVRPRVSYSSNPLSSSESVSCSSETYEVDCPNIIEGTSRTDSYHRIPRDGPGNHAAPRVLVISDSAIATFVVKSHDHR